MTNIGETIKNKWKNRNRTLTVFTSILAVLLVLYVITLLFPIVWGFLLSLKDPFEARTNLLGLPKNWLFSNYLTVLNELSVPVMRNGVRTEIFMAEMFLNSVLYAVGCALIQTFVQFTVAYVAARFKYKISAIFYWIVIFAMVFPTVGSNASALYVAEILHLKNSIVGMYVMKTNFLGVYFLVFYAQLAAFPKDYSDAAYLDGAGYLTTMFEIMFPLVRNSFMTILLIQFVGLWNDYTTPMLFLPEVPTLAYGLWYYNFYTRTGVVNNTPMRIAGCIIMMIPILIIFLAFHKRLMANLSMGGLKE